MASGFLRIRSDRVVEPRSVAPPLAGARKPRVGGSV